MFNYVARMKWEKQVDEERKHFANVGKAFSEPSYPELTKKMEDVEIEREEFVEISCSSEDEISDDENVISQSFKSVT